MEVISKRTLQFLTAICLLAVFLGACSVIREENQGFEVPPFEDIEPLAFIEYPNTTVIIERIGSESSVRSIDGAAMCSATGAALTYELDAPVMFSEIQNFYNEAALDAGWEIENSRAESTQELFHPDYVADKEINGRTHTFSINALQPDGTGYYRVSEDEPVIGFEVSYGIRPDPDHPFC